MENNPVKTLDRVYSELEITVSNTFRDAVERFIESNRNYRKNRYNLTPGEKEVIRKYVQGTGSYQEPSSREGEGIHEPQWHNQDSKPGADDPSEE